MEQQREKEYHSSPSRREEKSTFEKVLASPVAKQVGRTVAQSMVRGLLGVLGIKSTATRSTARKTGWW